MRGVVLTSGLVLASVIGTMASAWAHDSVTPRTVVAGSKVTVTVSVANEADQPTNGVEMRLPPGFALATAEDVPGWRSELRRRADGVVTAVRWSGGTLDSGAVAEFVVAGVPRTAGSLVWTVAQRSVGDEAFVPPAVTFSPRMTVTEPPLASGPAGQVPPAVPVEVAPPAPIDELARSRATLALVLAGLALLGMLLVGAALIRRSEPPYSPAQTGGPTTAVPLPDGRPAGASAKRKRQRLKSARPGRQ